MIFHGGGGGLKCTEEVRSQEFISSSLKFFFQEGTIVLQILMILYEYIIIL